MSALPWRVGARVPEHIYDGDGLPLVTMPSAELAWLVVAAVNRGEPAEHTPALPSRGHWLADLMVEWARSEYPRLFPPEWRHASLVGWLMNEALLTSEQAVEVRLALGAPGR